MLEKLIEFAEEVQVYTFWSALFGMVRTLVIPHRRNIATYLTTLLLSVPLGILAGTIAVEYGVGFYTSVGISSFTALIAEDIIFLIIKKRREIAEKLVSKLTEGKQE